MGCAARESVSSDWRNRCVGNQETALKRMAVGARMATARRRAGTPASLVRSKRCVLASITCGQRESGASHRARAPHNPQGSKRPDGAGRQVGAARLSPFDRHARTFSSKSTMADSMRTISVRPVLSFGTIPNYHENPELPRPTLR